MTAEIAIMNRSAVALAADSTVSISAFSDVNPIKTYESADKIFELSTTQPIGIMIFNDMTFMQIPYPTLIKEFRKKNKTFDKVEDAAKEFLQYLQKISSDSTQPVKIASENNIILNLIYHIRAETTGNDSVVEALEGLPDNLSKKDIRKKLHSNLCDRIDEYIHGFGNCTNSSFLNGSPQYTRAKSTGYMELVKSNFPVWAVTDKSMKKFDELFKIAIKKEDIFSSFTGLVFAGFGEKEMFPSLVAYEIDGVVDGNLKYSDRGIVDIDREGPTTFIIPFAQRDMVDRFVDGIDRTIKMGMLEIFAEAMKHVHDKLKENVSLAPNKSSELSRVYSQATEAALSWLNSDGIKEITKISSDQIVRMVRIMPKPEMANMARSLVELTSMKRRMSSGIETVGGPIDVSVISKEDGFVWIDRKHYFDATRNLRFMHRNEHDFQLSQRRTK